MKKFFFFLLFGSALTARSQEVLTIQQAIDIALERNHTLRSAEYDLSAARWGKWNSVTNFLPKVELSSSATRIDQDTYIRANAAVDFIKLGAGALGLPPSALENIKPFAYLNSYETNLTVIQPVFNGGLEIVGLSAAGALKDRSEYSYLDTKQDIVSKIKTTYLNVLKAEEFVSLATESLERTKRYLETTKRRADLGSRTETDVLRWEVQYSADEVNLITAKNYLALAKLQLNDLMGVDLHKVYTLEKIIQTDSATTVPLDTVFSGNSASLGGLGEAAQMTFDRLSGHPSMMAMKSNLDLAGINISKEWTNFLPRINFVYQYGWERNESVSLDGIRPWSLTLSLKYPIFSSFRDFTSLERSYAEYYRAEEQIESFKTGLVMQATNAQLNVNAARMKIETTRKGLRQALDVLNSVTRRYESGGASNIDVIDVQTAYTSAKTNYITAVYDYYISEIQLERATGTITQ
jgi:outer membrane protein TolC